MQLRDLEMTLSLFLMQDGVDFGQIGKGVHSQDLAANRSIGLMEAHEELEDLLCVVVELGFSESPTSVGRDRLKGR